MAMVITGQNTTEILFKYIFYTNNNKTLGVLLVKNLAEELLVESCQRNQGGMLNLGRGYIR